MTAPPPDSPAVELRGLARRINGIAVVDQVDLCVGNAELLALVGPSGCGKSTLLRSIAGLDPAQGEVRLRGTDVSSLPTERRHIGLVFQDHALFPHLRVDQNIEFGVRRRPRPERRALVGELLELVRLPGVERRYPHELSGGEQQRVALARALAPQPSVVLLDEPFASLDATLRDSLRADLVTALRERGTTAILVTHDRHEALMTGDRVAVMNRGRIVQVDVPEAVYERPVDRFVATFLGDAAFVATGDGDVALARPHHLRITPGGEDRVVTHQYLGGSWLVEVARPDGSLAQVDVPTDAERVPVGARCTLVVTELDRRHRMA